MREWASSDNVDDPTDALHSWRDPSIDSVCDFDGVDCDHYYYSYWISDLNLDNLNLAGTLPPWMWSCVKDTINLSNNQWYNTTQFYQDITSPGTEDFTASLSVLNCSNCGFFYKVAAGEYVLPEEWSKFKSLTVLDISYNPNLIGQFPNSWVEAWDYISRINIENTGICEPMPFTRSALLHIEGDAFTEEQCPDLPPYYLWEPPPPPTEPPDIDILEHLSTTGNYIPEIEPITEEYELSIDAIPILSPIDTQIDFMFDDPNEMTEPIDSSIESIDQPFETVQPINAPIDILIELIDQPIETVQPIDELIEIVQPMDASIDQQIETGQPIDEPLELMDTDRDSRQLDYGPEVVPIEIVSSYEWMEYDTRLYSPIDTDVWPSSSSTDRSSIESSQEPEIVIYTIDITPEPEPSYSIDVSPASEVIVDMIDYAPSPIVDLDPIDITSVPTTTYDQIDNDLAPELASDEIDRTFDQIDESPIIDIESTDTDCRVYHPIGNLSVLEIFNFTPVRIEFHQIDVYEHDLCNLYLCEIYLHGEKQVGLESTIVNNRRTWEVFPSEDGEYSVTLNIFDTSIENCSVDLSSHFILDREAPSCHLKTVLAINASTYIEELECDEDIFEIDKSSIEISLNGELLGVDLDRRSIRLFIGVRNYKSETIDVVLPKSSYRDRAGNEGSSDIRFQITIKSNLLLGEFAIALSEAPIDEIVAGTILASSAISSSTVFLSGGSSSGFNIKSNIIRASFHLQFLSFTANLAVPKLSSTYVKLAEKFSWTTLAASGNEPWQLASTSGNDELSNEKRRTLLERSETHRKNKLITTLTGCAIVTAICIILRTLLEFIMRYICHNVTRPKLLTFPRLELQALAIMVPPLMYSSSRLILTGDPAAIQAGLCCIILLVLPYTAWILFHLTIRSLILRPEIYYEEQDCTLIETEFDKRKKTRIFSTVSGELIGVPAPEDLGIVPLIVPPHEEGINDFVRDVEQPLSGRRSSTPKTATLQEERTILSPLPMQLRGVRIQPTSSDNEDKKLLHRRHSTASVTGVDLNTSTTEFADSANNSTGAQYVLKERDPQKRFIAKYGFVFEDVIDTDGANSKTRLCGRYLITYSLFFTHKILAAVVFGCSTDGQSSNAVQVSVLLVMHLALLSHLLIVRPYAIRSLYWMELLVNFLETTILIGASSEFGSLPPPQIMDTDSIPRSLSLPFQGTGVMTTQSQASGTEIELHEFWRQRRDEIAGLSRDELRAHSLPLARIKKIMKSDEDVRMISAEAPILFSKACEIFILELTQRAWNHAGTNKRRTVQRSDVAAAISSTDIFDFLVDIVPREGFEQLMDIHMMGTSPNEATGTFPVMQRGTDQGNSFSVPRPSTFNVAQLEPHIVSALFPRFKQQFGNVGTTTTTTTNQTSALSDCTSETGNCINEDMSRNTNTCQK
eukprot:g696.t1